MNRIIKSTYHNIKILKFLYNRAKEYKECTKEIYKNCKNSNIKPETCELFHEEEIVAVDEDDF